MTLHNCKLEHLEACFSYIFLNMSAAVLFVISRSAAS